jgi:hypothetical protein
MSASARCGGEPEKNSSMICAASDHGGEFAAAVEPRRPFPGVTLPKISRVSRSINHHLLMHVT